MNKPHSALDRRFKLHIHMESDWHLGSGMGIPGSVDRLVQRDETGLPFIPAKSLRGVLRDACEKLAFGLDAGTAGGPWEEYCLHLFGDQPNYSSEGPKNIPTRSAFTLRRGGFPPAVAGWVRGKKELLREFSFVKPGVAIDPATGSAMEDCLRFEEMARGGVTLQADGYLDDELEDSSIDLAMAFLACGARLVEGIGGKRRRGAGRCTIRLTTDPLETDTASDARLKKYAKLLADTRQPHPPIQSIKEISDPHSYEKLDDHGRMIRIPIRIKLLGPLSVTSRTVGNILETLDHIPGTYLLPHVTRHLARLGKAAESLVRSGIRSGRIIALPGTLEVDNSRGIPVPLCFSAPKGEGFGSKSLENLLPEKEVDLTKPLVQLKQIRSGYIGLVEKSEFRPAIGHPEFLITTHNSIHDEKQRPTSSAGGGVYSVEAINHFSKDGPVYFRSELRVPEQVDSKLKALAGTNHWWQILDGPARLGRSKKDEYGAVELRFESPVSEISVQIKPADSGYISVCLLSDTLIRDKWLRPSTLVADLLEELNARLGVPGALVTKANGEVRAFARSRRLETWHTGWNLPRPSLISIQGGSCFLFKAARWNEVTQAARERVLAEGIGDRRAEGYGQIAINPDWLDNIANHKSAPRPTPNYPQPTIEKDSFDRTEAAIISAVGKARWKNLIQRQSVLLANDLDWVEKKLGFTITGSGKASPSLTQISAFREFLLQSGNDSDRKPFAELDQWLDNIDKKVKKAGNSGGKLEGWKNALPVVRELLNSPDTIWAWMNTTLDEGAFPELIPGSARELQSELRLFAIQSLVDACVRSIRKASASGKKAAKRGDNHGS